MNETIPTVAVDTSTHADLTEESTWWIVLVAVSGFCGPLFIIWLVIKILQCRRHGCKLDYIYEEDEVLLDPIEARKVNFLYNKAALGKAYRASQGDDLPTKKTRSKTSNKKRSTKKKKKLANSVEDNEDKMAAHHKTASEALRAKFSLPQLKSKRKKKKATANSDIASDDGSHLVPMEELTKKKKKGRLHQLSKSVSIMLSGGSKVRVPLKTIEGGLSRPLPPLPPTPHNMHATM